MSDLISIVVPVYNAENYIDKCGCSLIKQTYKNIEIIFINDGSIDNSLVKLQDYAKDPRVKIITKKNGGVSSARNIGIKNASGEFLIFVDADDFLTEDAIDILHSLIISKKTDLVVSSFSNFGYNITEKQTLVFPKQHMLCENELVKYITAYLGAPNRHSLFVYSWGRLFRRNVIENNNLRFSEDMKYYEDVLFNFEYLSHINSVFYINKPLYNFRHHRMMCSATTNLQGDPEDSFTFIYALEKAREFLFTHGFDVSSTKLIYSKACVSYTIIQLIRLCGNLNWKRFFQIRNFINQLLNKEWLENSIDLYIPSEGESKLIPKAIKNKWINVLILVCFLRAYKRYG